MIKKYILGNIFFLTSFAFSCSSVYDYNVHKPIVIENIHATPENPYIIEGYEITNPNGNGIEIKDSENIIIRNNYLHDCTFSPMPTELWVKKEGGYAIRLDRIVNLRIENNCIEDNFRGIYITNSQHIVLSHNTQTNAYRDACFKFRGCYDVAVYKNYTEDNGATEVLMPVNQGVGLPDGRLQGIVLWESNLGRVYNNTVINSSSDGIGVAGSTRENHRSRSSDFLIYNNIITHNGEQGIWFEGVNTAKIYNNYIADNKARPGFGGGSSGIMLEFDVHDVEIYDNIIQNNDASGITIKNSHNNLIKNNTIKNHPFNPGITIFPERLTLPEYYVVGSRNNKFYSNTFINNMGGIIFEKGEVSGTEIVGNIFDNKEEDSIKTRDETKWYPGVIPEGVIVRNNTYKESKKKIP